MDLSPLGLGKRLSWWMTARETERPRSRAGFPEVSLHRKAKNEGKGSAVQAGIRIATGTTS